MTDTQVRPEPVDRSRFGDLLAAEWIKMRSLRSTYWVLVLSAVVAIAINVNTVYADLPYIDQPPPPGHDMPPFTYDPLHRGLNDIAATLMALAAAAFGAITVFGEYTTGMIRTTLAAVPDRRAVVMAKVVLVAGITLLLGATVSVTSFFATNALLAPAPSGSRSRTRAACGPSPRTRWSSRSARSSGWRSAPYCAMPRPRSSAWWGCSSSCPCSSAATGTAS